MQRTITVQYRNGHIVPAEPLDMEEGEDILVVAEERTPDNVEDEDSALAQAIGVGLTSEPVSKQQVISILQSPD